MNNPKEIPEEDINRRVAEALGWGFDTDVGCWRDSKGKTQHCSFSFPCNRFHPLTDDEQLCRLFFDNWDGITYWLDRWHTVLAGVSATGYTQQWWQNPKFLANKELWILRALVAYKEGGRE